MESLSSLTRSDVEDLDAFEVERHDPDEVGRKLSFDPCRDGSSALRHH
jgi:hypothetical protein